MSCALLSVARRSLGSTFGSVFGEVERKKDKFGAEFLGNVRRHGTPHSVLSGFVVRSSQDALSDPHWEVSNMSLIKDLNGAT